MVAAVMMAAVMMAAVVAAVIVADILKGFHMLLPSPSQLVIRAVAFVVAAVIAKFAVVFAAIVAAIVSSMAILMAAVMAAVMATMMATMMVAEIVPTMITAAKIATSESASANVAATPPTPSTCVQHGVPKKEFTYKVKGSRARARRRRPPRLSLYENRKGSHMETALTLREREVCWRVVAPDDLRRPPGSRAGAPDHGLRGRR